MRHFVGVFLCLVGLGVLVASDALNASNGSDAAVPHAVYGDLLCMLGSFFYAVSNVGQEAIVKQHDRVGSACLRDSQSGALNVARVAPRWSTLA